MGERLDHAAEQLGIRVGTARNHLKSIFAKTGTSRQAQLVRLLLSGPPFVDVDSARSDRE